MNKLAVIVIPAYLIAILLAMILVGRKSKSYKDYALAGAALPWWVSAASIIAAIVGGATLVGYVGTYYQFGFQWGWMGIALLAGMLFMGMFAASRVRRLGKYTVSDILSSRYGASARTIAAFIIVVGDFATFCAMISSFHLVLTSYIGLNTEMSLILTVLVFMIATLFGGFKGLAWTDVVQTILILGGVVVTAIFAFNAAGGAKGMATLGQDMLSPFAENKPWLIMAGTVLSATLMLTVSQSLVIQKLNACKSPRQAKAAVLVDAIIITLLIIFGVGTMGVAAKVIFGGDLQSDTVLTTLLNYMPQGIAALYAAAIVAAVLTSANAMLMSSGMSFTLDIVKASSKKEMDDKSLLRTNRIFIVCACILGYLLVKLQPSVIKWIMLMYTVQSCLFIPMYSGLLFKKASSLGAILSLVLSGLAVAVWEILGSPFNIHSVFIALIMGALGMVIGSALDKHKSTDEQLAIVDTFKASDREYETMKGEQNT